MKKNLRQFRKCKHCDNKVVEYYYNGRFKGYRKTCVLHNGYEFRKGIYNPSYKGGKTVDKLGYILILDERRSTQKGRSRYMLEHRFNMEKHLGRPLERKEIVHHLNGIKKDNRIENLCVIRPEGRKTNHSTYTYVRYLQDRIRHLESLILI